jgi:hypothetical protein
VYHSRIGPFLCGFRQVFLVNQKLTGRRVTCARHDPALGVLVCCARMLFAVLKIVLYAFSHYDSPFVALCLLQSQYLLHTLAISVRTHCEDGQRVLL